MMEHHSGSNVVAGCQIFNLGIREEIKKWVLDSSMDKQQSLRKQKIIRAGAGVGVGVGVGVGGTRSE
ncbi:hypothetical protein M0804_010353 [Polistes exclamans]|nr:hypothetical protein M0804_010353 [Polistes exclamans]